MIKVRLQMVQINIDTTQAIDGSGPSGFMLIELQGTLEFDGIEDDEKILIGELSFSTDHVGKESKSFKDFSTNCFSEFLY